MPGNNDLSIKIYARKDMLRADREKRLERFRARMAALRSRPPRMSKHDYDFRYKRHTAVFDGYGNNIYEYRKKLAELRAKQENGTHIEIHQPKIWIANGQLCLSFRYYTRKLIGRKENALATPAAA